MINKNKLGLVLGGIVGFLHLFWVILVANDLGAKVALSIQKAHFWTQPFTTLPFNVMGAVTLIVSSIIGGYIIGFVIGAILNFVREK